MGLKQKLIVDQEDDYVTDRDPEKIIRERRHLQLLEKVKRFPRGDIHPVLPKLKGMERARRKLERHLNYHGDDCVFDMGPLDKGELSLGNWWNDVREEFSDLNTGVGKTKEIE